MRVLTRLLALAVTAAVPAQQLVPTAAETTARVDGRVIDLRGDPVAAAEVWIADAEQEDTVLARTVADGDGFFTLGKVSSRDQWRVFATAPDKVVGRTWHRPGGSSVRVELQDAVKVTGRLRDRAGKPVAGVIVRAALDRAGVLFDVDSRATTDAEGRFSLIAVPIGMVAVAAVVPGEGLALVRRLVAGDTEIDIAPTDGPCTDLSIVVKGLPAERLAAGVRLEFRPYLGGSLFRLPPPWYAPLLDADGKCALRSLPDWSYSIGISVDGFVVAPREMRVDPGNGVQRLEFTAEPSGQATLRQRGTLHDSAGKPLAGVGLVMRPINGGRGRTVLSADDGSLTLDAPVAAGLAAFVESIDKDWVLDQQKDVDSHSNSVARYLAYHECKVNPAAVLALRAVPACSVSGRIVQADGRPAALVEVRLEDEMPNRWPHWFWLAKATTDRDGRYAIRGVHHLDRPGRVSIADKDGGAASGLFAIDKPGTNVDLPELKARELARVEGVVRDAAGKVAPGVRVMLLEWDFIGGVARGGRVEVISDRQGRYRFQGAPPGSANLWMTLGADNPTSHPVEPFEVEVGKTHSFDLVLPPK